MEPTEEPPSAADADAGTGTPNPTRATLWVLLASATLTVMAGAILGPVVPAIRDGLGVSGSLAGLIITTHGAFIVLTSPLAGCLVDRYGPRRPFVAGLLVYAAGGGAGLVVDSFVPLLASRAVLGVGTAFVHTGITVLIYDLYAGPRMDRALGLRSGANSLGASIWPLVGGALGTVTWQLPFGVYLVALPLGLLAVATVPATGRGAATETSPNDPDDAADAAPGVLATLRRRPALALVYLLYFAANALLYAIVVFYPQLLAGIGVTSSLAIGGYLAANGAAGGVSATLYDRLKPRVGGHRLVLAAFALWLVGFAVATVADSPLAAVPPVLAFGLGLGLVFPACYGWVESLAPTERQGQFAAYVPMAGYVGQFASPILFGPFVAPLGLRGVFAAAAVTAAVGLASLVVALGRRG